MILGFRDYQSSVYEIDFDKMGQLNESHQYSDFVGSVMDKLTFYVKRNAALENSNLNESAKRAYRKDIRLNRDERIAAACIFNEMLVQYKKNMDEDLSVYEAIISNESVLEEGVEYDDETLAKALSLNEEIKIFKKLTNVAKTVLAGAKDLTAKGVEVVKAKKDDLVTWAKEAKKDMEEKYNALKELVGDIVKKGIDSIEKFINKILDVFTSIGDNLVDAVKKLGGLSMDKGEVPAKLDIEDADGIYKDANGDEEKSFINNIILRAEAILNKDKENAAKLMTESYVAESIVDNKFIAWLAGYKSDGTKMSWWKCILIGICASLIVWLLPKVLVLAGLGGALAAFIAALTGLVWNGIGMLKLIYRRNKERKDGEKFFDRKTSIFFAFCLLANFFSVATFLKTIGPLMREICNTFGWTGGDDMSKFGEFIFNITKKISPKNAFQEGGFKEVSEQLKNYGGDVRGNDLVQSSDEAVKIMKDMPGASEENIKAFKLFLDSAKDAKGTSAVYQAWEQFKDNADLPYTAVFDTSKWGGSGPIKMAIDQLQQSGALPDSALLGTVGSQATQAASKGAYGFCSYLTGINQDQANMIFQKACEIAGKDMSTLQLHEYGLGEIAQVITVTTKIDGIFDVLAPNVPFLPMVMPFFDKKKWGEYKMRFASATRGSAAYVVDHVDMISNEDAKKIEDAKALNTLTILHDKAWDEYQKLHSEEVSEGLFSKKKENDKKEKVEEPQYVAFYIRANEDTGHEPDKLHDRGNSDSESEEKSEEKDEKKEPEVAIGVVIDTLTMMCADVCNFNESVHIRKRPQPYFMKGLFSRLSFRPTKDNDNDTKDYIRQTLGQTMKTLATQCVMYGTGSKYIDSAIVKKKAQFAMRDRVLGDNDKTFDPDRKLFELGNFSPKELLACVTDQSSTNKIAYDFLDGSFASKISIKTNDDGSIKSSSAVKDASTIENVKYYRVSKESYTETMDDWKKEVEKWEKDGKTGKKPARPTYIKGDDKQYYKRASKAWLEDPKNKRKKRFDFVDIRIVPLLKKGELYKKLTENDEFKKVLYTETEEGGEVKLNKQVIKVLKPFLFRPEKTFAKDDEYQLSQLLKDQGVEGNKLGFFKSLVKDEKQLSDTFKDIVEIIWDYLQDNRRKVFKGKDFKPNHGTVVEDVEYTLFDELLEEFFNDDYDEECEYEYDMRLLELQDPVLSYEDYLIENF